MYLTPFSGLSVFVHLMIVGLAKITGFFRRETQGTAEPVQRIERTIARRRAYYVLSALILTTVASFMLFSFALALHSGVVAAPLHWQLASLMKNIPYTELDLYAGILISLGSTIWLIEMIRAIKTRRRENHTLTIGVTQ